ncbi:MAG: EVE domain-containing protein [Snowella sp.]|nr:EVE domain-containing protein [Snowella sp.]
MKGWWVNQGFRFKEERELSCLWSPVHSKDGREVPHWKTMREVKIGDIVFHYYKGSIRAYSYVIEEAKLMPRPDTKGHNREFESTEGYLVKVKITDLNPEIALEEIPEAYYSKDNTIFTKKGFPKQGYLFPVYDQLTNFLSNQISMITGETKELIEIPEDSNLDWRNFLQEWRKNNSIITPPNLAKIRDEFNQRFPKEKLDQLTLEDYALGNPDIHPHSFCQFIEFEAKELGSIAGGSASKHGVYWSKADNNWRWDKFFKSSTAEKAFEQIKMGFIKLVESIRQGKFDELDDIADQFLGKNRNVLRGKPLYLYYPDKFIPIFSIKQLNYWLDFFDLSNSDHTLAKNLILFDYLKSLSEFQGFDSWGIMRFLYDFKEQISVNQINIWKIAPGEQAWQWEECVEKGFIGVGWDQLGDVSEMDRNSFTEKCKQIIKESGGSLKMVGLNQVWIFTNDIKIGDRIVANRGTKEVIGIGTVIGESFWEENQVYSHRIPVNWDDLSVYSVNEPGWKRTLIRLDSNKLAQIMNQSKNNHAWIFQGNPNLFDLKSALSELDQLTWLVKQNKKQIHAGDRVFFWQSGNEAGILGTGIIISEPEIQLENPEERVFNLDKSKFEGEQIRVLIDIEEVFTKPIFRKQLLAFPELNNLSILRNAQGTNFPVTTEEADFLEKLISKTQNMPEMKELMPLYTWEQLQQETGYQSEFLERLERTLKRKKQIILTGCPGSGKTYLANKLAQYLTSESDGFIELIQFHPAYTYEDFMQGLRPLADNENNLTYQIVAGRFLEFCEQARNRQDNCVLIIDEINRANLAAVFGELMYLLEYRDRQIKLAVSNQTFSIPDNVYVIGTMNTADRSIALVDHALRRRFAFIELHPDYNILQQWHYQKQTNFKINSLIGVLNKINQEIGDHHYHIGISFFLDEKIEENIADIWELEIIPYLEEMFYGSPDKLQEFIWENVLLEIGKV